MFKKIKDKLKNNKALMISLVAVLIILIGGVSYAAYDYSFTGKDSKLESGSVSIKFLESNTNVIDLKNALPISDSEGKKGDSFDFAVTTKASYDTGMKYTLNLKKLSVDSGYTSLNDNQVKIYLTDYSDSSLLEPTLISNLSNKLLYTKTNSHSSSKTEIKDMYKLRVWIDQNVDSSSWTKDSKFEYKFKIGLKSEEVGEILSGVDTLISKVGFAGLEAITHEADSSLQIGASESITEYRFRGASPSNYVTFNDEVWRIIGVFPTEGSDGVISNRIKLIRSESIGNAYWDKDDGTTGLSAKDDDYSLNDLVDSGDEKNFSEFIVWTPELVLCNGGSNNWSSSSLNSYLNSTYYESIIDKDMLDNVKYYLGGYENIGTFTTKDFYGFERKISGSDYYSSNNPTNVVNSIALMYVSDYGYAASDECKSTLENYDTCKDDNWLFLGSTEYFVTPYGVSANQVYVGGTSVGGECVDGNKYAVRPVLYLKPNIKIISGNGTSDNPYEFSIS